MCIFLKGGKVYPVPPSLSPQRPCVFISLLCFFWVEVVGVLIWGNEVSGGVGWLWEPWSDYLNMFSPATSSHWGL